MKSPWKMQVGTCVTLWYLFKTKQIYFFLFFTFLSKLPSTQTIKVISLIFLWAGLEKLGYKQAFYTYIYSLRSFSRRGGGTKRPPQAIHKFRPPAFLGFKRKHLTIYFESVIKETQMFRTDKALNFYKNNCGFDIRGYDLKVPYRVWKLAHGSKLEPDLVSLVK